MPNLRVQVQLTRPFAAFAGGRAGKLDPPGIGGGGGGPPIEGMGGGGGGGGGGGAGILSSYRMRAQSLLRRRRCASMSWTLFAEFMRPYERNGSAMTIG